MLAIIGGTGLYQLPGLDLQATPPPEHARLARPRRPCSAAR